MCAQLLGDAVHTEIPKIHRLLPNTRVSLMRDTEVVESSRCPISAVCLAKTYQLGTLFSTFNIERSWLPALQHTLQDQFKVSLGGRLRWYNEDYSGNSGDTRSTTEAYANFAQEEIPLYLFVAAVHFWKRKVASAPSILTRKNLQDEDVVAPGYNDAVSASVPAKALEGIFGRILEDCYAVGHRMAGRLQEPRSKYNGRNAPSSSIMSVHTRHGLLGNTHYRSAHKISADELRRLANSYHIEDLDVLVAGAHKKRLTKGEIGSLTDCLAKSLDIDEEGRYDKDAADEAIDELKILSQTHQYINLSRASEKTPQGVGLDDVRVVAHMYAAKGQATLFRDRAFFLATAQHEKFMQDIETPTRGTVEGKYRLTEVVAKFREVSGKSPMSSSAACLDSGAAG